MIANLYIKFYAKQKIGDMMAKSLVNKGSSNVVVCLFIIIIYWKYNLLRFWFRISFFFFNTYIMSSFSHKISNSVTNWLPETEVSFITSLTWLRRTCLRTTTRSSDNMLLLMMNKIVFMFVNQSEFRMSKNQNEYNDNTDYNCKKTARSSTLGGSYGIDESRFGGHRTWCH